MTGEITLRGRVLPIGGLKEKLLAAARGGIKTVLIPEDNAKDLTEISDAIKGGMDIIPVARLDDVVSKALVRPPVPIVWEEDTKVPVKPDATDAADEAAGGLTAH
jgi:ATP-dependent Lon protease